MTCARMFRYSVGFRSIKRGRPSALSTLACIQFPVSLLYLGGLPGPSCPHKPIHKEHGSDLQYLTHHLKIMLTVCRNLSLSHTINWPTIRTKSAFALTSSTASLPSSSIPGALEIQPRSYLTEPRQSNLEHRMSFPLSVPLPHIDSSYSLSDPRQRRRLHHALFRTSQLDNHQIRHQPPPVEMFFLQIWSTLVHLRVRRL